MNETDSGQRTPRLRSGKGPVVLLTVIFSCTSFTLGYFVGKIAPGGKAAAPAQTSEVSPAQSAPRTEGGNSVAENQNPAPGPQEQSQVAGNAPAQKPASTMADVKPAEPLPESASKNPDAASAANTRSGSFVSGPGGAEEAAYFTVQLGAFKNRKEAERLRAKYSKKGYKMYVTVVKTDYKAKIYKVRSGEFRDKKDAESLSLKLKNVEGLNAYVTPVNE
ncbi:MAG: SPOR domain-containing protein [Nitrospirae bacterium]|nr:SPOR domain-containing protein [Nitrospirota bacterium]